MILEVGRSTRAFAKFAISTYYEETVALEQANMDSLGNKLVMMEMSRVEVEDYATFINSVINKRCLLRSKLEEKKKTNSIIYRSLFYEFQTTLFLLKIGAKIKEKAENAERVVPALSMRIYSFLLAYTRYVKHVVKIIIINYLKRVVKIIFHRL